MLNQGIIKNKVWSILISILGATPILIDGDGTFLIIALCISIPLFFAKDNWIE